MDLIGGSVVNVVGWDLVTIPAIQENGVSIKYVEDSSNVKLKITYLIKFKCSLFKHVFLLRFCPCFLLFIRFRFRHRILRRIRCVRVRGIRRIHSILLILSLSLSFSLNPISS